MTKRRVMTEIYKFIGERITGARIENGYSQKEFAEQIDVSIQQVAKYEKGKNRIPVDKLLILSQFVDKDILYFLE